MKRFALIGSAGYIAPRHLAAIKDTGNTLVAALDRHDSVGILDSYFPDCRFFTEFERFDRHIDLLRRREEGVDYVAVVSPNYLHDSHCRFALRSGAHAICEKPLVINPWNIDGLRQVERDTGGRIFTILQLRLHPAIIALREKIAAATTANPKRRFKVGLNYVTSRGAWYHASWKGDDRKSGGIATNIGIHFFDMLLWVFGPVLEHKAASLDDHSGSGSLVLQHADVDWFLSVSSKDLPDPSKRTFRSITVDGEEIEFSDGFTDLHTLSYQQILRGEGFGLDEAYPSIALVHDIRAAAHGMAIQGQM